MNKPTVVMDLDGVIHSYTSGWRGTTVIPDPPVPGIREAIKDLRTTHEVVVVSTRCQTPEGVKAVEAWLIKHDIKVDTVTAHKPPAVAYVDDRAIRFDGDALRLPQRVRQFKTWQQEEEHHPEQREVTKKINLLDNLIQSYRDRWVKFAESHPEADDEMVLKGYREEVANIIKMDN